MSYERAAAAWRGWDTNHQLNSAIVAGSPTTTSQQITVLKVPGRPVVLAPVRVESVQPVLSRLTNGASKKSPNPIGDMQVRALRSWHQRCS